MNITDVSVRLIENDPKLKGIVNITIDDAFAVHDIKVIEGEHGLFIAMPSVKRKDGKFRDLFHPINSNTREELQTLIINKYNQVLAEGPKEQI